MCANGAGLGRSTPCSPGTDAVMKQSRGAFQHPPAENQNRELVMNRQMATPYEEYQSYIGQWTNYKTMMRRFPAGDRRREDAEFDLRRVESELSRLRQALGIRPEDDDMMIAAVESVIDRGKTINGFLDIMLNDPFYADVRYNVLSQTAEYPGRDGKPARWTDADEAASAAYIEKAYGLYQKEKHTAALRLLFKAREYNPIIDYLEPVKWDGVARCEQFLTRWAHTDDTPYTREVSRLIFAGGIWRLYSPGCKFDDVPILIGTRQGEGKSSLIRFLAVKDEWYGEVNQFDGQQAIEQLYGKWVCEISELLALTRRKEVEASKAYITRTVDSYRRPYDRNTVDLPRRCVFLGTSNNPQPLTDVQNRRWYPITMRTSGYDLFDHEQECREYIVQCWAEMRDRYKARDKSAQNFAKRELVDVYREQQDAARQDDWREGAIEAYLADKDPGEYVCIRELTQKALAVGGMGHDPSVIESKDLGMIMARFSEWEKVGLHNYPEYGRQRSWQKTGQSKLTEVTDPDDQLPF